MILQDVGLTLYLPRDSNALALGAEALAAALLAEAGRRGIELKLIRTGSRGLFWLEPLLEVLTPEGTRIAHGPVTAADVASLFDCWVEGRVHALCLGPTEEIAYLKKQERLTCARLGIVDPLSLDDYLGYQGYRGLQQALNLGAEATIEAIGAAGLRGRGGAAFPTGIKWRTVRQTAAAQKYIVCNADEGDSGSFADRLLMEGDPFALIEGMSIAGLTVGADKGYIYVRSEYPHALATLSVAIGVARERGYLGSSIMGSGRAFDLEVRKAAGSYVCGEETALLESLEGKRGVVRAKPPLPAVAGLFGQPTVINNVLTLATVPLILAQGADNYRAFGAGRSLGTLPWQLAGNVRYGGLVEKSFGISLRELLYDFGGGTRSGRPIRAVQLGGPLGAWLRPAQFELPLTYEAGAEAGTPLGHGSVVVCDDTINMARMARHAMAFCARESCGTCTPCRIGAVRGEELINRIMAGDGAEPHAALLRELCDTMMAASLCAMGGMTPYPVLSALNHFPEDFAPAGARELAGKLTGELGREVQS